MVRKSVAELPAAPQISLEWSNHGISFIHAQKYINMTNYHNHSHYHNNNNNNNNNNKAIEPPFAV